MSEKKEVELNWIITEDNVVVNYDGETHLINRSDPRSNKLIELLKEKDNEGIINLLDSGTAIQNFSNGEFQVKNGTVYINDFALPDLLGRKILDFMEQDLPYEPLVNFAKRLLNNPSNRSLNSLYRFLEHNQHPITNDGMFIAYKAVNSDFTDVYSRSFDNSPGKVVEVPRNQVDENVDATCSYGLHVANWHYAHDCYRGDVMVEVKVDPADVVAVPKNYNNSKMRVCRYVVLNEVKNAHDRSVLLRHEDDSDDSFEEELEDDDFALYEED